MAGSDTEMTIVRQESCPSQPEESKPQKSDSSASATLSSEEFEDFLPDRDCEGKLQAAIIIDYFCWRNVKSPDSLTERLD